ncbi:uncharacterized protein LOC120128870 [Hibiscus syriacus]|uniref:uncharacterized protein LOC120128870 n=1 Tax=Hibiscus syriacus TaxID=106335 RepID=UPI0019204A00|nr:uncharacterized protein LOC120128870 [Hibiscus syriacus]
MVWSAHRNSPVKDQALLELTSEGKLVLKDANDTQVWSKGKSVSTSCCLKTNHIVRQSFDHTTDIPVRGQWLVSWQKLRASILLHDSREGLYAVANNIHRCLYGFRSFPILL